MNIYITETRMNMLHKPGIRSHTGIIQCTRTQVAVINIHADENPGMIAKTT